MSNISIDLLVVVINYNPELLAIRSSMGTGGPYVHVVQRNIKSNRSVTVSDLDGNVWLLKFFEDGKLVFENITVTPIELINFVFNNIK